MPSLAPRITSKQAVKLSVLDRLLAADDSSVGNLVCLRENVRRDLEDLLNTRVRCRSWPPNLTELERSLLNYGLPDFTGLKLGAPSDQERFRFILQRAIEMFEPRLENVTVEKLNQGEALNRTLSFRIEAILRVKPYQEPIALNSKLDPLSATFAITRAER